MKSPKENEKLKETCDRSQHILGDPGAASWGREEVKTAGKKIGEEKLKRKRGAPLRTEPNHDSSKQLSECCPTIEQKKPLYYLGIILTNRRTITLESLSCLLTRLLL